MIPAFAFPLKNHTTTPDNSKTPFRRVVSLPNNTGSSPPPVVVTEFFTHGQLQQDGQNLSVADSKNTPVPWRLLQIGPGDFCRLAFQPTTRESTYEITYGGDTTSHQKSPPWTAQAGLLLETRHYRETNLNQLDSVRKAFEAAAPIGAEYVPAVYHRYNPLDPSPTPFLSRYQGFLRIPTTANYTFFTSSQDCSFLLVDGKPIVAAPGRHGPVGQARIKAELNLTAGLHPFEYLHAAAGPDACMVAAWQPPGAAKPEPIPPVAFGSDLVARLPAVGPYQGTRRLHDMALALLGEVPVLDSEQPLIRVQFQHRSAQSSGVRTRWDFGDGQTSTQTDPTHIYLHPGLFTITMTPGQSTGLTVTNRVNITRPAIPDDPTNFKPDELAAYLPLLDSYDPQKLDPASLLQLVHVNLQAARPQKAADLASTWLDSDRAAEDQLTTFALSQLAGPLLRDTLDNPTAALNLFQEAARHLENPSRKLDALTLAADTAINHLLQTDDQVKDLLDEAAPLLDTPSIDQATLTRFHRVNADWQTRQGNREAALIAYKKAQEAANLATGRPPTETAARQGAYSRSTEAFLRDNSLDDARDQLKHWQDNFPADKVEGYLPLLKARYWAAEGKLDLAIASPTTSSPSTPNPPTPIASSSSPPSASNKPAAPPAPAPCSSPCSPTTQAAPSSPKPANNSNPSHELKFGQIAGTKRVNQVCPGGGGRVPLSINDC